MRSDAPPPLSIGHGRGELPASRGPTAGRQLVLSGLLKYGGVEVHLFHGLTCMCFFSPVMDLGVGISYVVSLAQMEL